MPSRLKPSFIVTPIKFVATDLPAGRQGHRVHRESYRNFDRNKPKGYLGVLCASVAKGYLFSWFYYGSHHPVHGESACPEPQRRVQDESEGKTFGVLFGGYGLKGY